MKIEILGMGCPRCKKTAENTEQALKELAIEANVIKVEKLSEISKYGVVLTPAFVVDGELKVFGRIPSVEEVKRLLIKE